MDICEESAREWKRRRAKKGGIRRRTQRTMQDAEEHADLPTQLQLVQEPPKIETHSNGTQQTPRLEIAKASLATGIFLEGLIAESLIAVGQDLFNERADRLQKQMLSAHPFGDIHTALRIMRAWARSLQSDKPQDIQMLIRERGYSLETLRKIEENVGQIHEVMKDHGPCPSTLKFMDNTNQCDSLLLDAIQRGYENDVCVFNGHDKLGFTCVITGKRRNISEVSIANAFFTKPAYAIILPNDLCVALSRENVVNIVGSEILEALEKKVVCTKHSIPNVGSKVCEMVINESEPRDGIVLEKDLAVSGLNVFVVDQLANTVLNTINELIKETKEHFTQSIIEVPFPYLNSDFRVLVGEGLTVSQILFPGDSSAIKGIRGLRDAVLCSSPFIQKLGGCDVEFTWQPYENKHRKVSVKDVHSIQGRIYQILSDMENAEVKLKPHSLNKRLIDCSIRCPNVDETQRVFGWIQEAMSDNAPIQITNMDAINWELTRICYKIDHLIVNVVWGELCHKLDNCIQSGKYEMSYSLQGDTGGCDLLAVVMHSNFSPLQKNSVVEKINHVLQPLVDVLTSKQLRYLHNEYGLAAREMVSQDHKVFIHIPDFTKEIWLYGKKSNTKGALEALTLAYQYNKRWKRIDNREELPHDFNCQLMKCPRENMRVVGNNVYTKACMDNVACTECQVCWVPNDFNDDLLDLYTLESCGHVYCRSCIRSQLSIIHTDSIVSALCAVCNAPWSSQDLINVCGTFDLQIQTRTILDKALQAFVDRHPKEYRSCVRPGCLGVCPAPVKGDALMQCPMCSKRVCAVCFESYHGSISCANAAKWMNDVIVWMAEDREARKRCPRCRIGIERNEGCECMVCYACEQVFCWVCLGMFKNSFDCYTHMRLKHPI